MPTISIAADITASPDDLRYVKGLLEMVANDGSVNTQGLRDFIDSLEETIAEKENHKHKFSSANIRDLHHGTKFGTNIYSDVDIYEEILKRLEKLEAKL